MAYPCPMEVCDLSQGNSKARLKSRDLTHSGPWELLASAERDVEWLYSHGSCLHVATRFLHSTVTGLKKKLEKNVDFSLSDLYLHHHPIEAGRGRVNTTPSLEGVL